MELDDESRRAIVASLRRMQLLAPGEEPSITPLAGGVSSVIVRAETRGGPLCFKRALATLRTAREWHAPVERARAEAAYLRVAARILPGQVPELLGWDEQDLALALAWLPPESHPLWKTELRDGRVDPGFAALVGQSLVTLHARTADDEQLAREFANDAQFDALRLDPYLRATGRAHPERMARFEQLVATTQQHRRALVHGDVSPKNILVGPTGPVFLDAETAWYGDPAFDLAFCANHLLLKCFWRPAHRAAYLAAFDALIHAYLGGVDWEPAEALEQRAAALLPALLLARVDGKSPVEYLTTEEERAQVRRVAMPLVAEPPATLARTKARLELELSR